MSTSVNKKYLKILTSATWTTTLGHFTTRLGQEPLDWNQLGRVNEQLFIKRKYKF
jgi:hypothetical protein